MEPPRRTKRPAGDDGAVVEAPLYEVHDEDAAYDFLDEGNEYDDDDDLDGVFSHGTIGFLDESGSFVERATRGRGSTKDDLWLGAADADGETNGPAATKRARKALERQEEDELILEGVVGSRAVFHIKKRIAGILQPGETVPRALRRLKGEKTRGGVRWLMMHEAARRAFDELMDAAAELVLRGDLDAYTDDREAFEHAAWEYEYDRRRCQQAAAVPEAPQQQEEAEHQSAAAAREYYVDMFGDDAVDAGLKTAADSSGGHATTSGGQAANADQLATPPDASGSAAKEEAGVDDYVYDPASGYYYSGSTGHYYDAASGCYSSASTATWFSYHDAGQCSGTSTVTSSDT